MDSELQQIVDSLGRRLRRSVAIDDRNIRLLAYTSHRADVDDARTESVMRRAVPQALVRHVHSAGAHEAQGFFTVPSLPEHGLSVERIGLPIRHDHALLGFLWLLASDGPVTAQEAEAVEQAARAAAQVLHREQFLGELSRGRERELVRDLLSQEPRLRGEASDRLIDEELVVIGPVVVLVVSVGHQDGEPLSERDRLAVTVGLLRGRQRLPPRTAIQLTRPDHGILVMIRTGARREVDAVAETIHREVCVESGRAAGEWQVGIGGERSGLLDARASFSEAKRAAEVAGVVRILGPIVRYSGLGVYGLLAELPQDRLSRSIHPGVLRLIEHDAASADDSLVSTLEAFLDNAGNVKQTAAQLCIHRASVYYRLERIAKLADVDLSKGDDRLALHIGLKVSQLIGLR
ncbi:CdaR family transcriptional regulator [Nocardioides sp. L-11A]|uniref:PucR family transcriptional regulator n=1 Tax=Nocardioides sp. L-11A TaxID=3043848 RepID=UPI00249B70C6|nr:helix-turn-helix domain-containing protein [Nocardioides sp. L-11A]